MVRLIRCFSIDTSTWKSSSGVLCLISLFAFDYMGLSLTDNSCVSIFNQANHQFSTQLQRRSYGHATNVAIRPLNEEKAVQAAADLLGELFVFSVLLFPFRNPALEMHWIRT